MKVAHSTHSCRHQKEVSIGGSAMSAPEHGSSRGHRRPRKHRHPVPAWKPPIIEGQVLQAQEAMSAQARHSLTPFLGVHHGPVFPALPDSWLANYYLDMIIQITKILCTWTFQSMAVTCSCKCIMLTLTFYKSLSPF